jgi:hypothetical protein
LTDHPTDCYIAFLATILQRVFYSGNFNVRFSPILAGALSLLAVSSVAHAQNIRIDLTPGINVAAAASTDSVSRGISSTNGQPVLNVTAGYTTHSGLYGFVGGNNANNAPITTRGLETIVGGGYQTKLGNGAFVFDLGAQYHYFPGNDYHGSATYLNYTEVHNTLNWVQPWGALLADISAQPSGQYGAGLSTFETIGVVYNAPYGVVVSGRFGNATVANHTYNYNLGATEPNYQFWTFGLNRDLNDVLGGHPVSIGIVYSGASIEKDHDPVENAGNRVIGTVSYTF